MTIDEAGQYLIALKHCETCESNDANDCKTCEYHQKGSSAKCYDAIDIGIATMRKYQKIEEILKCIPYGGDTTVRRIQEVIEDDNSTVDNSSL